MKKLTKEQAFVVTCWSTVLFIDYSEFWKMAEECLGEPIINIEFGNEEIWKKLREKTKKDFEVLVGILEEA